jgi:hypothetical protein
MSGVTVAEAAMMCSKSLILLKHIMFLLNVPKTKQNEISQGLIEGHKVDSFFPIHWHKKKVKFSPLQALEALRVVRG